MPQNFVFVPFRDGPGKLHSTDRDLIRSHCMRGRNRKRTQATKGVPPRLLPRRNGNDELRGTPHRNSLLPENMEVGTLKTTGKSLWVTSESYCNVPRAPPLDLYFMQFPSKVNSKSKNLLFRHYGVASSLLYIDNLNESLLRSKAVWHEWFAIDTAFMHAIISILSGIDDFARGLPISKFTYLHLRLAINLLNQQLASAEAAFNDSTVAVVVMLAFAATAMGDLSEIRAHVAGLKRMIQLRGGLSGYGINSKLANKIRHLDISFHLITGETPSFILESPSTLYSQQLHHTPESQHISINTRLSSKDIAKPKLAHLFRELQKFTSFINAAPKCQAIANNKISNNVHEIFYSIQYRLIKLDGMIENVHDECIRLAMLAFMSTMYRVPGGKKMPNLYLADQYRICCKSLSAVDSYLQPWLLLVGTMSVFEVSEQWLVEQWRAIVPRMAWTEARPRLREVLWIDTIHDEDGEKIFKLLNSTGVDMAMNILS